MPPVRPLLWTAMLSVALAAGCGRCGGGANASASGSSSSGAGGGTTDAGAVTDAATAADRPALPADVPEVKDEGSGRATAALRAVLTAFGAPFDAATLERECKVDDDGASIDDLEDVAVKHGLEAGSVIVPPEHVLLAATKMLPAIVITDTKDDEQEFVVAWRLDPQTPERVQVMDPIEGRRWLPRADFEKTLHQHEMDMPVEELREAIAAPAYLDGLEARCLAIGVDHAAARALIDRAVADPGWRGIGALDAAIRKVTRSGGAGPEALGAAFGCAFEKGAECAAVPGSFWSVQPSKDAEGEVKVRGAVLLVVTAPTTR